jgi:hypothetical protein
MEKKWNAQGFFFPVLWDRWAGYHLQESQAKFDYRSEPKLKLLGIQYVLVTS